MNLIISFVTIFALSVLAGCGYQDSPPLFFSENIETLPTEFADYKYIDEITEFENYTIERFKTPPMATVEHNINKVTNNVIIKVATDIDDSTRLYEFYKLDTSGNIIDRHQFTRSLLIKEKTGNEEMVDGAFLVNKEKAYYSTWPFNGDHTNKPFIPVNQALAWSTEQVDAYYKEVVRKSARLDNVDVWKKISTQENKRRIRKIYYLNSTGEWYILHGNSLDSDHSGKGISGTNTLFTNFTDIERSFGRYIPPSNIMIPYFEKQTHSKFCAPDQVGCHMSYRWDGVGYYQVTVGESSLKFKNNGNLSRTDFKGETFPPKESLLVNFAYYTNPNLKYSLFSANDNLYLIKQK
ncbi:hypothetical protein [Pseudomonas purpurea]|uniref:hypothetical protein n=1 Tax=Pseudomonas purpurea TaxID=3136737 RepID=UPI0032679D9E